MRVTEAYLELMASPLDRAARPIAEMCQDTEEGHREYGPEIADFSVTPATYLNRLIPPYNGPKTHGDTLYNDVVATIISNPSYDSVLDLGCGSGHLLAQLHRHGFSPRNLYGVTIHIGECKVAHEMGLPEVAPIDMRTIDKYFLPESFDCVVSFWGMNHINYPDRVAVVQQAHRILRSGGLFIAVDYQNDNKTRIPQGLFDTEQVRPSKAGRVYEGYK